MHVLRARKHHEIDNSHIRVAQSRFLLTEMVLLGAATILALPGVGHTAPGVRSGKVSGNRPSNESADPATEADEPHDAPPRNRLDIYGDPLPRGAISRLGTVRYRHNGWYKRATFLGQSDELAIGTKDNGVRIWSATTGGLVREIDVHDPGYFVAFAASADGKTLATIRSQLDRETRSYENQLRLWNAQTGEQGMQTIRWECSISEGAKCLAFSPDARTIVTGHQDGMLRFWDRDSQTEILNYSVFKGEVEMVSFSPDGEQIAAAGRRGVVVWNWLAGAEPHQLPGLSQGALSLAYAPNGQWLATGSDEPNGVRVWKTGDWRVAWRIQRGSDSFYPEGLAFSSDSKRLAVPIGQGGHRVDLVEAETGKLIRSLSAGATAMRCAALSAERDLIAGVGSETAFCVWRMSSGDPLHQQFSGHNEAPYQIEFTPDGGRVITGCMDGTVRSWNADDGCPLKLFDHGQGWVCGIAVSPDGEKVTSIGFDNTVRVWNLREGNELYRLIGHGRDGGFPHYEVAFVPAGDRLLSWGNDLNLRIWDMRTGKALEEHGIRPSGLELKVDELGTVKLANEQDAFYFDRLIGVIADAKFSADRRHLFLKVKEAVHRFDTSTGQEVDRFQPDDRLSGFALSPDGKLLGTLEMPPRSDRADDARQTTLIRLRDLTTKGLIQAFELPDHHGQHMMFSPDGRMVAVTVSRWAADQRPTFSIHLWDTQTGQEVAVIDGLKDQAHAIAFSPDSQKLASSHSDTTTLIWNLDAFRLSPDRVKNSRE
jgi:WD40 repeat protein